MINFYVAGRVNVNRSKNCEYLAVDNVDKNVDICSLFFFLFKLL